MDYKELTKKEYYNEFKKKPNKTTISDLEREIILTLTLNKYNIGKIARELGKSFVTIAEELSKLKEQRTKHYHQTHKKYKVKERKEYVKQKLERLSKVYYKTNRLSNLEKEIIIVLAQDSEYQLKKRGRYVPNTHKISREINRREQAIRRVLKIS